MMIFFFRSFFFLFLVSFFLACNSYYLDTTLTDVSKNDLSSSFTKTPDRRRLCWPKGERLLISWRLSNKFSYPIYCKIYLLFKDKTYEIRTEQLHTKIGNSAYFLLGEDFEKKGGILSYKVEILDQEGRLIKKIQERMWFEKIKI